MITATAASISGAVNPDGVSATFAFELGVYDGLSTQYGIVFSGAAGASSAPVEETLALTGLQPGTTYSYRITVSSGYIKNESHTLRGAPSTFTTAGLPSLLNVPTPPALLAVPSIAFPATVNPPGPPVCKRAQHGRCLRPKKAHKPKKKAKARRKGARKRRK